MPKWVKMWQTFVGPSTSLGAQILPGHPGDLKMVAKWPGWTYLNLEILTGQILITKFGLNRQNTLNKYRKNTTCMFNNYTHCKLSFYNATFVTFISFSLYLYTILCKIKYPRTCLGHYIKKRFNKINSIYYLVPWYTRIWHIRIK